MYNCAIFLTVFLVFIGKTWETSPPIQRYPIRSRDKPELFAPAPVSRRHPQSGANRMQNLASEKQPHLYSSDDSKCELDCQNQFKKCLEYPQDIKECRKCYDRCNVVMNHCSNRDRAHCRTFCNEMKCREIEYCQKFPGSFKFNCKCFQCDTQIQYPTCTNPIKSHCSTYCDEVGVKCAQKECHKTEAVAKCFCRRCKYG